MFPYLLLFPQCQLFRNRIHQSALLPSHSACPQQGPLAPSCFQDFPATMGLSDSRPRQISRLCIPDHPPAFTPGRGGSPRFLDASFSARSPLPPRDALQVLALVSSLQISGFSFSGRLAASNWCNEAETGSLALGLTLSQSAGFNRFACPQPATDRPAFHDWLPAHRGPPLHAERAIHMADTFSQQDTPGLAWRTRGHRDHREKMIYVCAIYE